MDDLTDAELPGYFDAHCRTERALFHKSHIVRLVRLSGDERLAKLIDDEAPEFMVMRPQEADPLIRKCYDLQKLAE